MRFDRWVRPGMMVREVKVRHPESAAVFERYGFRGACDDCSIEQVARKYGLDPLAIVEEINQAIHPVMESRHED